MAAKTSFTDKVAERTREAAERARATAETAPLTPAEKQARYRKRLRGEAVAERKPGRRPAADKQRAEVLALRARVAELEAELARLDKGRHRVTNERESVTAWTTCTACRGKGVVPFR